MIKYNKSNIPELYKILKIDLKDLNNLLQLIEELLHNNNSMKYMQIFDDNNKIISDLDNN